MLPRPWWRRDSSASDNHLDQRVMNSSMYLYGRVFHGLNPMSTNTKLTAVTHSHNIGCRAHNKGAPSSCYHCSWSHLRVVIKEDSESMWCSNYLTSELMFLKIVLHLRISFLDRKVNKSCVVYKISSSRMRRVLHRWSCSCHRMWCCFYMFATHFSWSWRRYRPILDTRPGPKYLISALTSVSYRLHRRPFQVVVLGRTSSGVCATHLHCMQPRCWVEVQLESSRSGFHTLELLCCKWDKRGGPYMDKTRCPDTALLQISLPGR